MKSNFRPIPNKGKLKGYKINHHGLVKNEKNRLLTPQVRRGLCYYQLHKGDEAITKTVKTFAKQAGIALVVNPDKNWSKSAIKFIIRYNQLLRKRNTKNKLKSVRYIEPENRPNGRRCKDCGKRLTGGYYWRCPKCWEKVRSGTEPTEV